jgi:CDP-4-dehydro-6-deoxyglucose reductase, E3
MSYQVTVQPSGKQFTVEPNQFVLEAGIKQGVVLPYGCKNGACGSCKCKLVSGEIEQGTHQKRKLA